MILSNGDLIAITIAITSSLMLVITTAIANYRLTESRDYWYRKHQELKLHTDPTIWMDLD